MPKWERRDKKKESKKKKVKQSGRELKNIKGMHVSTCIFGAK